MAIWLTESVLMLMIVSIAAVITGLDPVIHVFGA